MKKRRKRSIDLSEGCKDLHDVSTRKVVAALLPFSVGRSGGRHSMTRRRKQLNQVERRNPEFVRGFLLRSYNPCECAVISGVRQSSRTHQPPNPASTSVGGFWGKHPKEGVRLRNGRDHPSAKDRLAQRISGKEPI